MSNELNKTFLRIDDLQEKCSQHTGCSGNYDEQHYEIYIDEKGKIEVYDSNCNSRIFEPEVITISVYNT